MVDLNYLKRLGLHGGRLGWRVLMILVSALSTALFELGSRATSELGNSAEEDRDGYLSDGAPTYENSSDEQWEAYYGKEVNRI